MSRGVLRSQHKQKHIFVDIYGKQKVHVDICGVNKLEG
jgi:hypothetical protein